MVDRRGRVRLVHWSEDEVPERAHRLEEAGFGVDGTVPGTSIGVKQLREDPPIAFVIDLGRLPSHGREVACAVRESKALRTIPIVFVDGAEEKVDAVRSKLPDATYTVWEDIGADLRDAIANPPTDPVVPDSDPGPRSGRPLAEKLGIKSGSTIALLDSPNEIEQTLAPLPDGVKLRPKQPWRPRDDDLGRHHPHRARAPLRSCRKSRRRGHPLGGLAQALLSHRI